MEAPLTFRRGLFTLPVTMPVVAAGAPGTAAGDPDEPLVVLLHGFPEFWYVPSRSTARSGGPEPGAAVAPSGIPGRRTIHIRRYFPGTIGVPFL